MRPADRPLTDPVPDPDTQHFWDEAGKGRFLLRRCQACGETHWYPRIVCPHCMSLDTEWVESRGTGEVHAYSVLRRVPVPYALAYVKLDEGPLMMTNIVDCELDAVHIGQRVEVTFQQSPGGFAVPMFRPAKDGQNS